MREVAGAAQRGRLSEESILAAPTLGWRFEASLEDAREPERGNAARVSAALLGTGKLTGSPEKRTKRQDDRLHPPIFPGQGPLRTCRSLSNHTGAAAGQVSVFDMNAFESNDRHGFAH